MKVTRWLGDRIFGARRHLEGVFTAVLLVPVAPDVFVDLWGSPENSPRNAWLRAAAVAAAFVAAFVVGFARHLWVRGRARRPLPLTELPEADVLVVPLSPRRDRLPYNRTGRGDREPEVPEFLCEGTRPRSVVGIVTPQLDSAVDALTKEFDADGITFVPVRIIDAYSPAAVIGESERIAEAVRAIGAAPQRILVDVTGGTAAMTIGMLRVAASLGARCVYVSSAADKEGNRVPYTQRGHAFDPRTIVGTG
ncbi:hypothetical protein [Gandjariella thermophila]|uniref:CRISPR-associated protein n=1 Tax=Gandjariella thermophila TaxID=1931992 RepID=A0A4D4JD82_9PSEU|nr:hypothetical protein [Gandjariella thermophila]GDY31833.1 hypothetical protein GTS_34660 [Gandjariella thermophila]